MWDESLPSYDGSFEHRIILLTLYFRIVLYYIILLLGLLSAVLVSLLPFIGFFLSYKSIAIKLKQQKKQKKKDSKKDKKQENEQNLYLNILDKKIKKKKKH